jgi:choline monooxygenase
VYVDNFLEGYHIPIVHPELAKLLDYKNYSVETHQWHSLQYSPLREEDNIYGSGKGEAFYYFIFPNIMLNILPGRLQTNVIRPVSVDKTEVLFSYYYRHIESKQAQKAIRDDIAYSHEIQLEDIEICERVQTGLGSKAYHKGRFSVERERGVYHFQCLLKEAFREVLSSQ